MAMMVHMCLLFSCFRLVEMPAAAYYSFWRLLVFGVLLEEYFLTLPAIKYMSWSTCAREHGNTLEPMAKRPLKLNKTKTTICTAFNRIDGIYRCVHVGRKHHRCCLEEKKL